MFMGKIEGFGPRSMQIHTVSADDDGWYQCHVGVYVNKSIVEKIGYSFLNILGTKMFLIVNQFNMICLLHLPTDSDVTFKIFESSCHLSHVLETFV